MSDTKKKIAVFFGGRSPEHDVSVVTGLQILNAIDQSRYDVFPVYIAPDGAWLTGEILRERSSYLLSADLRAQTEEVLLDTKPRRGGRLVGQKCGLFSKPKEIVFDVAIPAFHGLYGEDGGIQGLFDLAGVPYAGMRAMAASVLMDKAATKKIMQSSGVPVLPYAVIKRPAQGYMIEEKILESMMGDVKFPCIVKPVHMGSSIGVAKANDIEALRASLPVIFQYDSAAIIEPFVENLVEYNVAVRRSAGNLKLSAIERPKAAEELLDFKQKYLSGGSDKSGDKMGSKTPGTISQGMLSLTRELNPHLDQVASNNIKSWAAAMFEAVDGTGAPRIDFISNGKTGEIWLNEVNPWPGSIGYFLWEAAAEPLLFTELMDALIEEALSEARRNPLTKDPVPADARLFSRRG